MLWLKPKDAALRLVLKSFLEDQRELPLMDPKARKILALGALDPIPCVHICAFKYSVRLGAGRDCILRLLVRKEWRGEGQDGSKMMNPTREVEVR